MTSSKLIKDYIDKLWKKEYPQQGSIANCCEWEEKIVPIDAIICDGRPQNIRKAKKYAKMVKEGCFNFAPIICINDQVIDGYHRFWAYKENNFEFVKIYSNIPQ